jgi:hypothetical protein
LEGTAPLGGGEELPTSVSEKPKALALKAIANAIRIVARAMRMRLFMVGFLSVSGECFDGITIAEDTRRHITRTGYTTGYLSKGTI